MKTLLQAIVAEITTNLTYLAWVGVLDHELLPPEEPGFPLVGVRDGDVIHNSRPGQRDLDTMTVVVCAYQSIMLSDPGGSIIGSSTQLGERGKGLLDISAEIRSLLNDNYLDVPAIHYAHCDREHQTQTLPREQDFIQLQRLSFTYRRYVS